MLRIREAVRAAGAWRTAYEIALVVLVTVVSGVATVGAEPYPGAAWVLGVSAPVLVVMRLVYPFAGYVAAAVIMLGTGGPDTLLLFVLTVSLAYRVAEWWKVAAGLGVQWVCAILCILWEEALDWEGAVLMSVVFVLTAVLPAGVARIVRQRRTLFAAMHHRNVQLHRQQAEVARRAQVRERARIARDMHDSLGHKLTLLSLYAGMLRSPDDEKRVESAELVRTTSAAAMTELRQILGILAQDDTQPAVRPLTGLDELAEQARASGARIEVVREGEPRPLASLTEHAAYRVIQEGVTNALRHAAGAQIVVSLRYEPDALVAGVTNTAGRSAAGPTTGQGLLGLAERVRVAGGMLYHGATPDGGFRLAATLPQVAAEPATEPAAEGAVFPGAVFPPAAEGADFTHLVDRSRRRSRFLMIGTAVAVLAFVVLCCAGGWIATSLISVDRETFDAVRIGQPEAEVRAQLPDPEAAQTSATGLPVPGEGCIDYQASLLEIMRDSPGSTVYRFCFRDGVLADKQALREGS